MATINKLSVRGVRSFSPEEKEQVIEFYCPLTIIVGANGCGKTTIIESLKYAITGALPPDSRKGQSFVHDAKSIGQQQVKASVKLRFTSKSEQSMVVVRSMELTQKKTTVSFKQLDGVLRTMDPRTGERQSLSHKCTELDKTVPQLMGVSKAILEHVLFCHQEDSSWPLMDSASLKKRFDEIFDSARYTKAIEVFKKKEKSYNGIAKDLKADIAGLQSHKHAAKGFQKELDEQHEVLEEIDETKSKLKRQMAKVDETITKYEGIVDQLDAVEEEIKAKEEALDRQEAVIEKQREMLEEDLTATHSLAELKTKLRDFDRTMATQQEQLRELEGERDRILGIVEGLRGQEMEISNKAARYELAKEEHQKRLRQRYALMESIAQNHSLDMELSQTQADQSFAASVTATSMIASDIGTQDSLISIAPEDMQGFFETLNKKEEELKAKLEAHKRRSKEADEEMQEVIQDLAGKIRVAKNDLEKLRTEKEKLQAEQVDLSKQVSTHSRLRKSDVEEARKKANKLAKQRDEAANDPRQQEIKTESRQLEDKIDRLKRSIEDDRILRDSLRVSAEAQNSIALLEEQCAKDVEGLEEALRDQASTFQKFNIPLVGSLPKEGDENGDQIVKSIEDLKDFIKQKFDDEDAEVSRASEELNRTQKILSEKTALMTNCQQTMNSLKPKIDRLNGSVEKAKKVAEDLRRHDIVLKLPVRVNEQSPKELLAYIDERLVSIEEDSPVEISLSAMKKIAKRLQRMAKVADSDGGFHVECPCCKRDFGSDPDAPDYSQDVKLFQDTLTYLSSEESPLLKVDTKYLETKANYEGWKNTLVDCMDDLRDHQRMSQELKDVETENQRLLEDISHYQSKFRKQQSELDDLQSTHEELRDLVDASKRWGEDAYRVSEKRMQIAQKSIDLAASVGGDMKRDLKAVERDLNRMIEEKDEYTNKLNNLSREMGQINTTNSNLSQQASRMDQIAREKELRFATEQKSSERKAEVAEQLQAIGLDEKKLRNQIAPLEKKLAGKKDEKEKTWALYEEDGNALSSELSSITSEVKTLHSLTSEIDKYEISNQPREQEKLAEKASSVKAQITERQKEAEALQPRVEEMKRAVHDQERHKNLLTQNIDMLESRKVVGEITKEIEELREQRSQIEEGDTAGEMYEEAKRKKNELQELKFRTEGRFSEVVEQIRSLKRKLAAPEYRNVEEEYRIAMIKYETTTLSAQDLKKYYTALDKALLQFHGRKIADINRIIRELWMMTYKGGDITSIEIVSGQDPGSKASKSYNYRVVMSKGSSRLDMRGRCSAGQRVLASIVIRLALAETFGVNCGCIALDEPTVNLDYRNKKGLAVALAQIVASRSSQKNFQLIMITHDEEFVSMMKTELSSLTGFSMPEKYFQVRREQHIDGKYYSKIDAVDWNEMV